MKQGCEKLEYRKNFCFPDMIEEPYGNGHENEQDDKKLKAKEVSDFTNKQRFQHAVGEIYKIVKESHNSLVTDKKAFDDCDLTKAYWPTQPPKVKPLKLLCTKLLSNLIYCDGREVENDDKCELVCDDMEPMIVLEKFMSGNGRSGLKGLKDLTNIWDEKDIPFTDGFQDEDGEFRELKRKVRKNIQIPQKKAWLSNNSSLSQL